MEDIVLLVIVVFVGLCFLSIVILFPFLEWFQDRKRMEIIAKVSAELKDHPDMLRLALVAINKTDEDDEGDEDESEQPSPEASK